MVDDDVLCLCSTLWFQRADHPLKQSRSYFHMPWVMLAVHTLSDWYVANYSFLVILYIRFYTTYVTVTGFPRAYVMGFTA